MKDSNENITDDCLDQYRRVLNMQDASDQEMQAIREHFLLVAKSLCEYLLGRELD